jgi:hypothetical protein
LKASHWNIGMRCASEMRRKGYKLVRALQSNLIQPQAAESRTVIWRTWDHSIRDSWLPMARTSTPRASTMISRAADPVARVVLVLDKAVVRGAGGGEKAATWRQLGNKMAGRVAGRMAKRTCRGSGLSRLPPLFGTLHLHRRLARRPPSSPTPGPGPPPHRIRVHHEAAPAWCH